MVGQTVAVAQNKVANAGLKASIVGSGDTVLRQVPEAGQSVPAGGTVLLYTEEVESNMVTVPNLLGKSVSEVNSLASSLGLNVQLSGLISSSSTAAISNRQSIAEGQKVPRGTVIEVNFYYSDTADG